MKVLYLMPQATTGDGLAAYPFLDEELFALADSGVQAWFVSTTSSKEAVRRGVTVCSLPNQRSRQLALALGSLPTGVRLLGARAMLSRRSMRALSVEGYAAEVAHREGVDVIHSHFAWPSGVGGTIAADLARRPLVASLRGTDILEDERIGYGKRRSAIYDHAVRTLVCHADRTVYFSGFMREQGVRLGARPALTRVVRKGVDVARFRPAADRASLRRSLGLGAEPMLLTVGGLIARKGIDATLRALVNVRDHPFSFVVCGEGPDRTSLEALARDVGLGPRVRFAGRVSRQEIPRYFAACEMLIHAPWLEAAGNVLFEAMASGRPIVCTRSGGPEEYVKDGVTGLVVPPGDEGALASAIATLLLDPSLADRMGSEGRRAALGEFSYGRMVRDIVGIYEEVTREGNERVVG